MDRSTFLTGCGLATLLVVSLCLTACARSGIQQFPRRSNITRLNDTPPPAHVRFFNASTKKVEVPQAGGIVFTLRDGSTVDAWGDGNMSPGDQALRNGNLVMRPSGSTTGVVGVADLNVPIANPTNGHDTTVTAPYRTVGGSLHATAGTNTQVPPINFALPSTHEATGDIRGVDMLLLAIDGPSAGEVTLSVWLTYEHGGRWYTIMEHRTVSVP